VAEVYSRRVSFNEKLYLASDSRALGFCIQIVMEGQGLPEASSTSLSLAPERLAVAVAAAATANPGARLVLRGVLGFARWVATGPVPPVRVLTGWTADGPPRDLEQWLPPATGPTCEVVLCPGTPDRLVFRCFHGVMDARGLLHFAEDVFRSLRGEPLVGSDCTLNDTEMVRSMSSQTRPMLKGERLAVTATSTGPAKASAMIHQRLTVEKPGTSLVARIAAGLARHATQFHSTPTRVMVPVDLRNYQKSVRATGNLTCPLFLEVDGAADWKAVQKDIVKRLVAKEPIKLDPTEWWAVWFPIWAIRILFGLWNGAHIRSRRFPASALVSHMALPGAEELSCPGFHIASAWFLPNQDNFLPLVVAIISNADRATILVSAPSALVDAAQLTAVCGSIREAAAG
jgi:hypothetical protein